MSMYKEASMLKLRFTTQVGVLSVEQLWDLTQSQLSTTIKNVKKVLTKDNDDELSFLETNNVVDTENQLRFDILKDIYLTKKSEQETLRTLAEDKAHNNKIDTLIAMKKESQLQEMTIEELEKLRK
jgi:hypothetical protein